jgi:hypothetical protein
LLGFEISSAYKYHVTIEICLQMINLSIEMSMSESKALACTIFELQMSIFLPSDHGRIYILTTGDWGHVESAGKEYQSNSIVLICWRPSPRKTRGHPDGVD